MSNLLQVIRVKTANKAPKGRKPLILEFRVNPQTVPYLVSSSNGVMWIDEPIAGDPPGDPPIVKAAVRKVSTGDLFWEASKAIYDTALECQWGSAHPFTEEGLAKAIEHVESYDMGAVDILVGPAKNGSKRPAWLKGKDDDHRVQLSAWIPENCAVVVPTDRQFVGLLVHVTPGSVAMALHNPSRGFAMCWGSLEDPQQDATIPKTERQSPPRKKRVA